MVRSKIFKKPLVLLTLFSLPAAFALFRSGFFPTHDYHLIIIRLQQLFVALTDNHFPVRWARDLRYGEPLFNFYAPLVYYLGAVIHLLGFSFIDTAKILFALSLFFSSLSMYFLAKEFFKVKGALVSAVLYTYAPYRAVDIYVRGALSEAWAFVFLPLIFLFIHRVARKQNMESILVLSFSLAGLFYTHSILTLIFSPFVVSWALFLLWTRKKWQAFKVFLGAGLLGVGLAASFLLPAFFEKSFVQTDYLTTDYFDFHAHFVALRQILEPFWGYGASVWGVEDEFPFQLGLVHWATLGLSTLAYLVNFKKITTEKKQLFIFLAASFWLSLFMLHNKSTFIWERVELLSFVQFPWRFLTLAVFFASLLGGFLVIWKNELVLFLVIVGAVVVNYQYFRPESHLYTARDENFLSKEEILHRNEALPKDYLSVWTKVFSNERVEEPENFVLQTGQASFTTNFNQEEILEIPVMDFPGWHLYLDGERGETLEPSDLGLIKAKIPPGQHQVKLRFENTRLRRIANLISLASLLAAGFFYAKNKKV